MKFRFYITDLFRGEVVGTDDSEAAAQSAKCEDFFVVDALFGKWLTANGEKRDIGKATLLADDPEEEIEGLDEEDAGDIIGSDNVEGEDLP
jgi:hypothetical protein